MENTLNIKYIVYLTTNKVNNKIYIGVHKTETPYKFDGYLGCGAYISDTHSWMYGKFPIHAAIRKYGTYAFNRKTLKVFDNLQDALDLERWLVDEEFISRPDTYNATVGGGMHPLLTKSVYQFDLDGNFIKKWDSEQSILDFFDSKVSISNVVKNKRNFAGYFWSFDNTIDAAQYTKVASTRGRIDQYDLNGNFITSYKNTNTASQLLDIDFKRLNTAVFRQKPCDGYYFIKSGIDTSGLFNNYKPTINKCSINRYLSDGTFDKEYPTIVKAVKDTFNANESGIKRAVVNGATYKNYLWSFYKDTNYFNLKEPTAKRAKLKIAQYDKQGNLLKIWDNPKECKKEFPYCYDVCRRKCKSTKGYVFKYIESKDIV